MNPCTSVRARLRAPFVCTVLLALLNHAAPAAAQQPAAVLGGRVLADGQPVAGVLVALAGRDLRTETNAQGVFRFPALQPGAVSVTIEQIGWRTVRRDVTLRAGETQNLEIVLEPAALLLDEMVVTTSRETQRRAETPATIHSVPGAEIERLRPSHPSELMNRVPGVWVNTTGGEGHMAAIRHPMTTNPVYLYLENGVPTRSTGFFNHNALYEIDVPNAGRVEVVKGPATALYGSDAIGGLVNVLTRAVDDVAPFALSLEGGPHGFGRALLSGSAGSFAADVNVTRTDGWRDGTGYDRQSGTVRSEHATSYGTFRPMLTFSHIDQNTAGTSALPEEDFENAPTRNYTPISYRRVDALRTSLAWEHLSGSTLLSVTPFARWNRMEMLPNWSLTYDPAISRTGHASLGALLKVRTDADRLGARAIAGLDLDYSPGTHREWAVTPVREDGVFTSYTKGDAIYDYDVAFYSASPYTQLELSPVRDVRVVAGMRLDLLGYTYDNQLDDTQEGAHRRPADTSVDYSRVSPKLGMIWEAADELRIFGSWSHGFRAPSEGQLFRQGRTANTTSLRPVRAVNLEVGAGGVIGGFLSYDVALYRMRKHDDVLSFTREDGSTETVNAGETLHRGVEVGTALALPWDLRVDATFSRAEHEYHAWVPRAGIDYSGNAMESAPERTATAGITWTPRSIAGASIGVEAQHVGPFWMDAANIMKYDGHTTVALRAEAPVTRHVSLFARVTNLFDERYAELAQYTTARGAEYAPGLPRSLYIGARYR